VCERHSIQRSVQIHEEEARQSIKALPLNGRDFERLVQLRPGVVNTLGTDTDLASSNESDSESAGVL
jgi:hypothetical protein